MGAGSAMAIVIRFTEPSLGAFYDSGLLWRGEGHRLVSAASGGAAELAQNPHFAAADAPLSTLLIGSRAVAAFK